MGEEHFIAWGKEHQEKIKEHEEAKKDKAADISTTVVQSTHKNIVEQIDSKSRMVSFQGGR